MTEAQLLTFLITLLENYEIKTGGSTNNEHIKFIATFSGLVFCGQGENLFSAMISVIKQLFSHAKDQKENYTNLENNLSKILERCNYARS